MAPLRGWRHGDKGLPRTFFMVAGRLKRWRPCAITGSMHHGSSRGRSTARVSVPERFCCTQFGLEMLSSATCALAHPLLRRQATKVLTRPESIEQVFAKLKHRFLKAAARTVDTVCIAIGNFSTPSRPWNAPITFRKDNGCRFAAPAKLFDSAARAQDFFIYIIGGDLERNRSTSEGTPKGRTASTGTS